MPFIYELKIAAGEPSYTFVQQLVALGSLMEQGQAICTLTDGKTEFHLAAPREGLLVEWLAEHGAVLEDMDSVARVVSDGAEVAVPAIVPVRLG